MKRSHIDFIGQNQMNPVGQKGNLITEEKDSLFEQKLELAIEGLEPYILEHLKNKISPDNALTISKYIFSMRVETSLSNNYKRIVIS